MAGKQQPPYLNLAELTASQFLEIWKHYDADGNGYIEGKELENFIRELQRVRRGAGVVSIQRPYQLASVPLGSTWGARWVWRCSLDTVEWKVQILKYMRYYSLPMKGIPGQ
eukprot:g36921.t1